MKKITFVHLLNDYSGSPKVLSLVINGFIKKGWEVDLVCSPTEGFLSNLEVNYIPIDYTWVPNKFHRLFKFLVYQLILFFKVLKYKDKDRLIYVNTLLPFGAALAGKWRRKKVIYHLHETSVKPASLKRFLKWVSSKTASKVIFVSQFLAQKEPIGNVESKVVYNALSEEFVQKAMQYKTRDKTNTRFTVLMLCSLKAYKGVDVFVDLAKTLPHLNFELVLNASLEEIKTYFNNQNIPENLVLFPKQSNVHLFYQRASVVLNLSHPEEWIETFGMTILEAMYYGLPAIVPPVGGPKEIIKDGVNGFQIDQRKKEDIVHMLKRIAKENDWYQWLSQNARTRANGFNIKHLEQDVFKIVESVI